MLILRRYLKPWGYDPHPWGLGTNLGIGYDRTDYEERFVAQLERVAGKTGRQVTLIGWSQGGGARGLGRAPDDAHPAAHCGRGRR